ncbi:OLC1v1015592C1 [Oldenlandia corymbosa var. corymbosa]|uniref:OLC1v1015592C1 n=1 Tax=Oldenlandia corymbosa var. corymbosa TaxID=529605 RepID=A0AAV1E6M9_OLDCO|nr:OLC1v1015592C1 [Oldenlandia corymbosa var. corymbosa]
MNGYRRVKDVSTARSRSIDFSDISFQSRTPKPISNHSSNLPNPNIISHEKKIPEQSSRIVNHAPPIHEQSDGEIFGVILNRKCSSSLRSSTSPHHNYFSMSDQNENAWSSSSSSTGSSVIKRVLSMKRSSSVSEGYSRIHHQCDTTAAEDDTGAGISNLEAFNRRPGKKKGKIFRACRRIFGF